MAEIINDKDENNKLEHRKIFNKDNTLFIAILMLSFVVIAIDCGLIVKFVEVIKSI